MKWLIMCLFFISFLQPRTYLKTSTNHPPLIKHFHKHFQLIQPNPTLQQLYYVLISNQTNGTYSFNPTKGQLKINLNNSQPINTLLNFYKVKLQGQTKTVDKCKRFCLSTTFYCKQLNDSYLIKNSENISQKKFMNIDEMSADCQERCKYYQAQNITFNTSDPDNQGLSIYLLKIMTGQSDNKSSTKDRLNELCKLQRYECEFEEPNITFQLKVSKNKYVLDDISNLLFKKRQNYKYINDQILVFDGDKAKGVIEFMLRDSGNTNFISLLQNKKKIQLLCSYGYNCILQKYPQVSFLNSNNPNISAKNILYQVEKMCYQIDAKCIDTVQTIAIDQDHLESIINPILTQNHVNIQNMQKQAKTQAFCKLIKCTSKQPVIIDKSSQPTMKQVVFHCLESNGECQYKPSIEKEEQLIKINMSNNQNLKYHLIDVLDMPPESNAQAVFNEYCDRRKFRCLFSYPNVVYKYPEGYKAPGSLQNNQNKLKISQIEQSCLETKQRCKIKSNQDQVTLPKSNYSRILDSILNKSYPTLYTAQMDDQQKIDIICSNFTCQLYPEIKIKSPPQKKLSYSKGELPDQNIQSKAIPVQVDKCPLKDIDKEIETLYEECQVQKIWDCSIFYDEKFRLVLQYPQQSNFLVNIYKKYIKDEQIEEQQAQKTVCQKFNLKHIKYGNDYVQIMSQANDSKQCKEIGQEFQCDLNQVINNQSLAIYQQCLLKNKSCIQKSQPNKMVSINVPKDDQFFKNLIKQMKGSLDLKPGQTYLDKYCDYGFMQHIPNQIKNQDYVKLISFTDKEIKCTINLSVKKFSQLETLSKEKNMKTQFKDGQFTIQNKPQDKWKQFVQTIYNNYKFEPAQTQTIKQLSAYADKVDVDIIQNDTHTVFNSKGRSNIYLLACKLFGLQPLLINPSKQNQTEQQHPPPPTKEQESSLAWLFYLLGGLLLAAILGILIFLCVRNCGKKEKIIKEDDNQFKIGFIQSRRHQNSP